MCKKNHFGFVRSANFSASSKRQLLTIIKVGHFYRYDAHYINQQRALKEPQTQLPSMYATISDNNYTNW